MFSSAPAWARGPVVKLVAHFGLGNHQYPRGESMQNLKSSGYI